MIPYNLLIYSTQDPGPTTKRVFHFENYKAVDSRTPSIWRGGCEVHSVVDVYPLRRTRF